MSSTTRISGSSTQPVVSDRGSYGADREERVRIAKIGRRDGPDIRGALERLRRLLASGEPLRDDVPRGYYLNIIV
ncbi:hypothetical protein RYZ26_16230 [Terasakiella sp. A23]|uniref:hypothetical protein n=1 Tax=Terasakiella sp. FCG-A23 TaxID=3080561 RepID=UPI002952EA8F|nr:hypothetical protein [Terasakiella sp. A23]MDV7341156.1 hypothetical protein [Terasakiella sp. A23]